MRLSMTIEGMTCAHCQARVTNALAGVAGTTSVKVDFKRGLAEVKTEAPEQQLRDAVDEAGYHVTTVRPV